MKNTLRLVLFDECDRNCKYCVNKQHDTKNLPICTDFSGYDEIILTGGEPMLNPDLIIDTVESITEQGLRPDFILYTGKIDDLQAMEKIFYVLDGLTVSLHKQKDVFTFMTFNNHFDITLYKELGFKFRLNIMKSVVIPRILTKGWDVKSIIPLTDCPVPEHETLMRLS